MAEMNSSDSKPRTAVDVANDVVEVFADSFSKENSRTVAIQNLTQMAQIIDEFCDTRVREAVKRHELEQSIERLDVQCPEEDKCTNCDRKRPELKELQAELAQLTQAEDKPVKREEQVK